ncbi:ATP-dependent Clp protease ATP-binding subunit ClpA [Minicystis rosea]|nr:ATP-dependent Clp protease ATP-binding subunit ClpA [Minicystis rosea]
MLVNEQFDGHCLVHPVTAPALAAYAREEDAIAELSLFLREHFARTAPEEVSRLSLPDRAAVMEVAVVLPREDPARRREADDVPVTFLCIVVPARSTRDGSSAPPRVTDPDHDDVWVLCPVLDHAFYLERGEPLEESARAEIRRIVGALDLDMWDRLGLLPPRAHRIEVLEVPLPDARAADEASRHADIEERARRRRAESALRQVATPLSTLAHRAPKVPLVARETELATLRSLLDGRERLGVLLVGAEHAGKTAIMRAYAAATERQVWATSGAQLIAGMSGLGQWQERIRDVMDAVATLDAVLYFESLDDLLAERVEDGGVDFAGAMRSWLDEGKVRVAAEIRADRLDAVEGRYWAFFAGLSRLRVDPLSPENTRLALERRVAHDALVEPERPRLAADAIPPLVDLAERYLPYGAFPGKAMHLYDDLRAAHEKDRLSSNEPPLIGRRELYQVFSIATGVPEMLLRDDAPLRIEDVAAALHKHVIGQEEAILRLSETIGVVKAGLAPSGKPLSTFLFIGPTGVGKTELSRALAAYLFGSPDRMVRFDMSEFMTPDAAERLIRGTDSADGLLTRRVREQPFCVLLLDEIEKAHPAVFDLLLQVAGEGRLSDARGRTAYFHNAILIMTSNLGAGERRTPAGFTSGSSSDTAHYQRIVAESFRQEFVGRIDRIVPFRSLTRAEVRDVARLGVNRLSQRSGIAEAGCVLAVSDGALTKLADEGYSETFGARAQRRHLDEHLAAPLSRLLSALGGEARDLTIDVTLASEPDLDREGVVVTTAEAGGLRFVARRKRRAQRAEDASDHGRIGFLRRELDAYRELDSLMQMKDQIDFLLTQLNLTDKEKRDGRIQREQGELSADHHRLDALWRRLMSAQEELHAVEELALVGLFEGQPIGALVDDAEKAFDAFQRALPYALVALQPRRDAITIVLDELDEGALDRWLRPLLDEMPKRGWSALVHVAGQQGDGWPADRRWGPPQSMDWLARELGTRSGGGLKALLLRVRGPYAGAFLALEAGLHRTIKERKSEGKDDDESGKLHLHVRTVALQFDVPGDAWNEPHLEPPRPASANARKRGPAARIHDEPGRSIVIARLRTLAIDPSAYWARFDEIALTHLLLVESGALDRDDYFSPAAEVLP